MTDRVRHLTVTLDEDTCDDDLDAIVSAIKHVRGVSNVERHVVQAGDLLARQAVRAEIQQKLHEAVDHVFVRASLHEMSKRER